MVFITEQLSGDNHYAQFRNEEVFLKEYFLFANIKSVQEPDPHLGFYEVNKILAIHEG